MTKPQKQSSRHEQDFSIPPLLQRSRHSNVSSLSWLIVVLLTAILLLQSWETFDRLASQQGARATMSATASPSNSAQATPPLGSSSDAFVIFFGLPDSAFSNETLDVSVNFEGVDFQNIKFVFLQPGSEKQVELINVSGNEYKFSLDEVTTPGVSFLIAKSIKTGEEIGRSEPISILSPYRISITARPYPDIDPQNQSLIGGIAEIEAKVVVKTEQREPDGTWVSLNNTNVSLTTRTQGPSTEGMTNDLGEITFIIDFSAVTDAEIRFTAQATEVGFSFEQTASVIVPTLIETEEKFDLLKLDDPSEIVLKGLSSNDWLRIYSIGSFTSDNIEYARVLILGGQVRQEFFGDLNKPLPANGIAKIIENTVSEVVYFGEGALGLWDVQIFLLGKLDVPPAGFVTVTVFGLADVSSLAPQ